MSSIFNYSIDLEVGESGASSAIVEAVGNVDTWHTNAFFVILTQKALRAEYFLPILNY